jgi:hypothetical protein
VGEVAQRNISLRPNNSVNMIEKKANEYDKKRND